MHATLNLVKKRKVVSQILMFISISINNEICICCVKNKDAYNFKSYIIRPYGDNKMYFM